MSAAADAAQDPRALKRRRLLILVAAVTLAATAWAALLPDNPPPASESQLQRRGDGFNPARGQAPGSAISATASETASAASSSWPQAPRVDHRQPWPASATQGAAAWSVAAAPLPPPPPPAKAAPLPAAAAVSVQPQAPAFPYVLIGRLDDGEPHALLSGAVRSFGVKAADVIDGQWRVDSVADQGLTLTWLPGSVKKTLTFGAS